MTASSGTPKNQPLTEDALAAVTGGGTYTGTDGVDQQAGSQGADNYNLGGGDDVLSLRQGDDYAEGGAGNDAMGGDEGADTMRGQTGNDYLEGRADGDQLYGDEGHDTLDGGKGDDFARGGMGDDTYRWHPIFDGNDTFYGDAGNNTVLLTYPGAFEQLGDALQIKIDGGVEGRWEDGALVFDYPVSGTVTVNGVTLTFHGVQRIADL
jgi:Ca2+-binding RTX toxin-like protein